MNILFNDDNIAKKFMPIILRRYRDASGMSQQDLANCIGVAKSYISALELGYRIPNLNILIKIAYALNVNPGKLVDELVVNYEKNPK